MIYNTIDAVEAHHRISLTYGLAKCIEERAASASDVIGFGSTLKDGYWHHTVFIRDGDITRELFFDPETCDIEEAV